MPQRKPAKPGEEPIALETDHVNVEQGTPQPSPKPPGLISVPVNPWDDEKLFEEMSNPKSDGEANSEAMKYKPGEEPIARTDMPEINPVARTVAMGGSKAVLVTVFFNEAIADSTLAPQDFILESKDGFEAASAVRARGDSIELMFAITPESYTLLQGLATSDSSEHAAGYSIRNNRSIRLINDSVSPGELAVFTAGQILGFPEAIWKDYVSICQNSKPTV